MFYALYDLVHYFILELTCMWSAGFPKSISNGIALHFTIVDYVIFNCSFRWCPSFLVRANGSFCLFLETRQVSSRKQAVEFPRITHVSQKNRECKQFQILLRETSKKKNRQWSQNLNHHRATSLHLTQFSQSVF